MASVYGVTLPDVAVCPGHSSPLDYFSAWVYDRPALSMVHGPRGGGKSYLAGLATHIESQLYGYHGTKILGGSEAQSQQSYNALRDFDRYRPGAFAQFNKTSAVYTTGSEVSILAASRTSVRGPHVPTLRLDEVDEIDEEIRDSAAGMCMRFNGVPASISMTSTWHNLGGPMGLLKDRADAGEFPWFTFCVFEILERCPEERSGQDLENCPECPLFHWCHDGTNPVPKAKRSNGHYSIEALIQKARLVSPRVFESDYLCFGPRAAGVWFTQFDEARHVTEDAEYDPRLPVHMACDSGVFTGAVFYQIRLTPAGLNSYTVFADYLSEGLSAEANATALIRLSEAVCNGHMHYRYTDPAGGSRNPVGPKVMEEYTRAGLDMDRWPVGSVADGLAVIESCVMAADGSQRLSVHPRCRQLVAAFRNYRRAKRAGQWMDYPQDPQHPFEDVMDALRGGVLADERGTASWGSNPFA